MRSTESAVRRIGPYTLLQTLGSGGMGLVFIARRDGRREPCVVKLLREDVASRQVVKDRFVREAHIGAILDHPRIARVLDAGYTDSAFFIALEWVLGVDLQELALANVFPAPETAATIVVEVLEALAYLHDAKDADGRHLALVHRDLSLRNIMVAIEGGARVIDFGVARMRLGEFVTAAGMLVGTLSYMAPEAALGRPVDHRADVYAMGVVLWELLAKRPWLEPGTPAEILKAVAERTLPPIHEPYDAIIARAVAKDPDERFANAGEMADALLAAGASSDVSAWLHSAAPQIIERITNDWETFVANDAPTHEATRIADEAAELTWVVRSRGLPTAPKNPVPWIAAAFGVIFVAFVAVMLARPTPDVFEKPPVAAPSARARPTTAANRNLPNRKPPSAYPPGANPPDTNAYSANPAKPNSLPSREPTNAKGNRAKPPAEGSSKALARTRSERPAAVLRRTADAYHRDGTTDRAALSRLLDRATQERGRTAAIASARRCLDLCSSFDDMIESVKEAVDR